MLPTADFVENGMPADAFGRLVEIELSEPDYNKWVDLARAGRAVASLSHVTAGETDRPYFSSSEVRLVGSLTGMISNGLRRSLVCGRCLGQPR